MAEDLSKLPQIYIGGKPKKKVGKKRLAPGARKRDNEKKELKGLREKNEETNEKRMLKRA